MRPIAAQRRQQSGSLPAAAKMRLTHTARWSLRKPSTTLWLSLLCWLALMTGGCAPQPDVMATDNDNGGQVHVLTGQLFDIVLADDYDQTLCQWREEHIDNPRVLEMLGSRYEWGRKPPAGIGNGTATERYRAKQEGTTRVSFIESSNNGQVCRRYSLTVTVGPPNPLDSIIFGFGQVLPWALVVAVPVGIGLVIRGVYRLVRRRRP